MLNIYYTNDPEENIYQREVNMKNLQGMYMMRKRRRAEEDGTVVEMTHLVRR